MLKGDISFISSLGTLQPENALQISIDQLTSAVYGLVQLHLNACSGPSNIPPNNQSTKEAWTATEHLQFTIFAAHGILNGWVSVWVIKLKCTFLKSEQWIYLHNVLIHCIIFLSSYEKYYLVCSLMHNGRDLFKPVQSKKVGTYKNFFYLIKWDEL